MSNPKGKVRKKKFLGARFTSTISIALVLFVLGLMGLSGIIASELSTLLREQFTVTLVLNDRASAPQIETLIQTLEKAPYARSVRHISKQEALQSLTDELGENPEDFLGYNPLSASIELQLDAAHATGDSICAIEAQILTRHRKIIDTIDYNRTLIDMVNSNLRRISLILSAIAALLLLISISLINNTIRLSLHADRFLIHTMRLVGATAWFIRKPFIAQGAICGLVAAVLALGGLGGLLYYGFSRNIAVSALHLILRPQILCIISGSLIGLGLFIPAVAAWRATDKYLKMKTDDLYLL